MAYLGVLSATKGPRTFSRHRPGRERSAGCGSSWPEGPWTPVRSLPAEAGPTAPAREPGTFTGFLENPTPVYRQAHVVCLVSLYDEPFGMVVTEAMAFGKTVVAYETGAVREILQEGETGFIVPKGDPGALARRILALVKERGVLRRIGANARKSSLARYNPSDMSSGSRGSWRRRSPMDRLVVFVVVNYNGAAVLSPVWTHPPSATETSASSSWTTTPATAPPRRSSRDTPAWR